MHGFEASHLFEVIHKPSSFLFYPPQLSVPLLLFFLSLTSCFLTINIVGLNWIMDSYFNENFYLGFWSYYWWLSCMECLVLLLTFFIVFTTVHLLLRTKGMQQLNGGSCFAFSYLLWQQFILGDYSTDIFRDWLPRRGDIKHQDLHFALDKNSMYHRNISVPHVTSVYCCTRPDPIHGDKQHLWTLLYTLWGHCVRSYNVSLW